LNLNRQELSVETIPSDVTELDADPTGQTIGGQLVVDSTHVYSDLDDLIVNHVQAVARRVEELMAHEKFKHGSEDELRRSRRLWSLFPTDEPQSRSLPKELCCSQSSEECLWVYTQPEEARSFQPMLLG
jgi:hypothetical protein